MPRRLPTPAQFFGHLQDAYDCKHEVISAQDPVTKKVVHGGRFTRTVKGDKPGSVREHVYADNDIGPNVSEYMIRKICGRLAIKAEDVLDHFDGALSN